jgi:putative ABC transport system substrate-binding protein
MGMKALLQYSNTPKKRIFSLALAAMLLALGVSAEAQQAKIYRVGVLMVGTPDIPDVQGLRDGLKAAGYVEGKNLFLDIGAKETYDELRPIAKAYIEKKVDVIVAIGGTAPLIAKESTQAIPIVFVGFTDPVAVGIVKSMARPEANVTGVARGTDVEMDGKRLQVFKEVVPTLRRVAVLYNARGENPQHAQSLAVAEKIAPELGLKLAAKPIKSTADIERILSSVSKDTTDGLFVICSSMFREPFGKIGAAAMQKRLPLMGCRDQEIVEQGALMLYGSDTYRLGHRAALYVERILKGAKPQNLPIETPTYFELVINLKAAKQIGLTIPPNVLARADRVIR